VVAANLNSPGQIVLSGDEAAVDRALELASAAGAKRGIKLKVGGAFHSPLMERAVELMRPELEAARIEAPRLDFVANVTADRMADPEAIREGLLRQITSCVRWSESMLRLRDAGATDFIEVGPGKVLVGLLRRIDKGLQGHNFGSPEDLEAVRALRG
jgi:[acyl-carrier-protein] S-malonyltransferase